VAALGPLFDHAIAYGQAVILLDGLDEVQSEHVRPLLVRQVEAFAAAIFLRLNGYRLSASNEAVEIFTLAVAHGEPSLETIADWQLGWMIWLGCISQNLQASPPPQPSPSGGGRISRNLNVLSGFTAQNVQISGFSPLLSPLLGERRGAGGMREGPEHFQSYTHMVNVEFQVELRKIK
jgi:hypothetical protein